MPDLLSQADYAKHRRCSRVAVHKALKAGRIEMNADGRIDPVAADAAWLLNSRARVRPASRAAAQTPAAAPPLVDEPAPYDESRARREQAEAGLAELQLGEQNGRLLDRARVGLAVFHAARTLRDQLTNSSGQLGAVVAGLTSARECEEVIRQAHRQLLDSFMTELARMVARPPAEPALE